MSVLRTARSAVSATPRHPPQPDPLLADPDAHRLRGELARGEWQGCHEFLEATRDADDRHFYVGQLAGIEGRPGWLAEWADARPDSPIPLLFRGAHGIRWAWQARSDGPAGAVTPDVMSVFYSRLVVADRDLARAAALDPQDPTPHTRSIWTAVGLALGQEEIRRRFGEVTRRHPWHRDAHLSMVQALGTKWAGSVEDMFGFARSVSAHAPEGSPAHVALAAAHLEAWASPGPGSRSRRFADPAVQQEIRGAARRSVLSPEYRLTRQTPHDRSIFAMCFWLMKDYQALLDQLDLIGPLVTPTPWGYAGDPRAVCERARAAAVRATSAARPARQPAPDGAGAS